MSEADYKPTDITLVGADHVNAYQESDGEVGGTWNGVPILLLTTTGRKSGQPRTQALIYGRDGDDYLVVASMGGAPMHPAWYLNLSANPDAEIQVMSDHLPVTASVPDGDERTRLWAMVNEYWPNYDVYQSRTDRVIPVVVLSPKEG